MTDNTQNSPRRAALVAALRRSAALIVILTLLGAGLGLAAGLMRSQSHTARASVLISPLVGNPYYPGNPGEELINLETEAQLVSSDAVARDAADSLGGDLTPSKALSGLKVSVPPNTQILTINYTAGDEDTAVDRAQAFADAYLDFRTSRFERVTGLRTERINEQLENQREALTSLADRAEATTSPGRRSLFETRIRGIAAQIAQLRGQLAELQTDAGDPGQVITPAGAVGQSALKSAAVFAIAGLLLGLFIALGIVVVRARAENRIHRSDDIDSSGLPLLGSISMNEVRATNQGIATLEGHDDLAIGAGLQSLRVSVLSRERRRPVRILYAAATDDSPSPRAALGLAYAAAASSLTTVLVDATGAVGDISRELGMEAHPGFSDVLAHDLALDQALTAVTSHLHVLPAGRPDPRADDLLTGPGVAAVFEHLARIADVVIVATGPLHTPRSQALAMVTDVTVVEAVESESRLGDLVEIADDPVAAGSVLGVVFVGRARSRPRNSTRS
jgi:capsular polysaccharide biosynthesis protein/Mrp family chromosome partitioning ATPase